MRRSRRCRCSSRVRESFLAPFRISDQMPTLTCSIGVSMFPLDAIDPVSLIKQADTAMYAAKDAGRNAYRFYTADMNARVQLRLQLETDMRRGLMDDEFFLVYQPQIEMHTGRACGVEALCAGAIRSAASSHPSEFIPVAEESGMIQALGRARAARQLPADDRLAPSGHDAAALGQSVGAAAAARQLARRSSTRRSRRAACRRTTSISRSPRASSSRTRRRRSRRSSS